MYSLRIEREIEVVRPDTSSILLFILICFLQYLDAVYFILSQMSTTYPAVHLFPH